MKYLCIGYFDPVRMDALPKDEVAALMNQCPPHMDTLYGTGKVKLVAGADNESRFLRSVGGKMRVSDGPAPSSNARIGCVFILETADLQEAVQLASLHPTTQITAGEDLGWYTEVRPVHYFYPDEARGS